MGGQPLLIDCQPVDSVHMRAIRRELAGAMGWRSVTYLSRRTHLRLSRIRRGLRRLKARGAVERAHVRGREAWRLTSSTPAAPTIDGVPNKGLQTHADVLEAMHALGPAPLSKIAARAGRASTLVRKSLHQLRRAGTVECRGKRWSVSNTHGEPMSTPDPPLPLAERQRVAILEHLADGQARTTAEIAAPTPWSARTAAARLHELQRLGKVRQIRPGRPARWQVTP